MNKKNTILIVIYGKKKFFFSFSLVSPILKVFNIKFEKRVILFMTTFINNIVSSNTQNLNLSVFETFARPFVSKHFICNWSCFDFFQVITGKSNAAQNTGTEMTKFDLNIWIPAGNHRVSLFYDIRRLLKITLHFHTYFF